MCPIQKYPLDSQKNPILAHIPLADPLTDMAELVDIDILIGADHMHDILTGEKLSVDSKLYLLSSKLGYVTAGKIERSDSVAQDVVNSLFYHANDPVHSRHNIERFWSIEDIGIKDNPYQTDDDHVLNLFNKSILSVNGRYEVKLPWKDSNPELPSNFGLAIGRLRSLQHRLLLKPEELAAYDATIKEQLQSGIIEEVNSQPTLSPGITHYIPHHHVVRPHKSTTKIRIVYDASARGKKADVCLNECLYRGPIILQDLCGMLIRFRLTDIAIMCDVEKAFLQVGIQSEDRDATRFSWLKDPNQPVTKQNLLILRFCRVPFGLICGPFLLSATIKHHLDQQQSTTAAELSKNLYVDNVLVGKHCITEATQFYTEAKEIFRKISMDVREWYSNSPQLNGKINSKDRGMEDNPTVLGIKWNTQADYFKCISIPDNTGVPTTKRELLSVISQVFDPCGLFSPLIVKAKLVVQTLWKDKLSWDAKLNRSQVEPFEVLLQDLAQITHFKINKKLHNIISEPNVLHQLHCFCDASAKAYAACVYVRTQDSKGHVSTGLVFAKARIAPINAISLPRLELMALLIGARITQFVASESRLKFASCTIWTDSKCALHWLHSNKELKVFVRNRVRELKSYTDFQYRYIPTSCNPAEIPSKGIDCLSLHSSDLWWFGLVIYGGLQLAETMRPENEFSDKVVTETAYTEVISSAAALSAPESNFKPGLFCLIAPEKYSSWRKLVRITGWVLRFLKLCRKLPVELISGLSYLDIKAASKLWIKEVQSTDYPKFITTVKDSLFRQLDVFQDNDGLYRCRGRLENSCLLQDAIAPILPPKNHYITQLIIDDCHVLLAHAGLRHTLAQSRLEYWIPQGRAQVQKVLRRCGHCRKWEGGHFRLPNSPPFPKFRVTASQPFENVGINYLGPLYIKTEAGKSTSKVWICLFTCAATRAIHLDIITELSTDQFLMCLRRFTSLYGQPKLIVSDNAKQFKATDKFLRLLERSVRDGSSVSDGIQWKYTTELAPWMGGFYERLVKSVKRSLRKTLGQKCLDLIQLQTVAFEISGILNSRPLVPLDQEPGDEALTPAHFLAKKGRSGISVLLPTNSVNVETQPQLTQSLLQTWKTGRKILDEYWRVWRTEYLASLRDRPLATLQQRNASNIAPTPGTTVLVKDNLPRCRWKLAKICKLLPSKDGHVRSAKIQLPNGSLLSRPLKLLHPLEGLTSDDQSATLHAGKIANHTSRVFASDQSHRESGAGILESEDEETSS